MSHILKQFDILFNTGNSIEELKELILDMAFKGKLLTKDLNDEPASVLLGKIQIEKELLIKEKKIKKEKPLPGITKDEIPFELPQGWEWARLQEVYDVRDGTHDTPKYVEIGIPLITSKNISGRFLDFANVNYISVEDHELISQRSKVDFGDILFAMIGSIGNPTIVETDKEFSIKNVALFKYYNDHLICQKYLWYYLTKVSLEMKNQALGGVQKFVPLGYLRAFVIPIPPLNEQKRIVEKVDQLMALCDQLKESIDNHNKANNKFNNSAFQRLDKALTVEDFKYALRYLISHLDIIINNSESVGLLRKSILNFVVQGKLVPQDLNDEPASALLEKIKAEKEQLVKDKKIKKEKALPEIQEDEIPYELPQGWEWVRLGEIGETNTGTTPPTNQSEYFNGLYSFIKPADITNRGINYHNESLSQQGIEKGRFIKKDSVMMVCIGGSIGKSFYTDRDSSCNQQINTITGYCKISGEFLNYLLSSTYFYESVLERATGSATPIINKTKWETILIPLPPFNEQKRIVNKVNQLMNLCDALEKKVGQSRQESQMLIKSVLQEAFQSA